MLIERSDVNFWSGGLVVCVLILQFHEALLLGRPPTVLSIVGIIVAITHNYLHEQSMFS